MKVVLLRAFIVKARALVKAPPALVVNRTVIVKAKTVGEVPGGLGC